MNNMQEIRPFCNYVGWSDVEPFEVVKVISDKTVEIRRMDAERDPNQPALKFLVGGFSAYCSNQNEQKWIITTNPDNPVIRVRYSKNKERWQDKDGAKYRMCDQAVKFYDYNF